MRKVTLVVGFCPSCGFESTEQLARGLDVEIIKVVTFEEARQRGEFPTCSNCGFVAGER